MDPPSSRHRAEILQKCDAGAHQASALDWLNSQPGRTTAKREPARLRAGGGAPSSSSTRRAAVSGAAPHLNTSLAMPRFAFTHAPSTSRSSQGAARALHRWPASGVRDLGGRPVLQARSLLMWMLARRPTWPAHRSLQASHSQAPPASFAQTTRRLAWTCPDHHAAMVRRTRS